MIPFVKMHGCGNDFIVVREADVLLPEAGGEPERDAAAASRTWMFAPELLARRACDRHFGVGADGLLVYGARAARDGVPRLRMQYWNADGSRAEMCGNGARCVVRLAFDRGEVGSPLVLETDVGAGPARVVLAADSVASVEIDMGPAAWEPAAVPVRALHPLLGARLRVADADLEVSAVSMGNPHAIVFVPDRAALARVDLAVYGRGLAEDASFPEGANASFVAASDGELFLRVWERGVGPTLACGTATCAAYAVARRLGRLDVERVTVHVPGGAVVVWQTPDGHLWLAGPAAYIASGTLAYDLFDSPPGGSAS